MPSTPKPPDSVNPMPNPGGPTHAPPPNQTQPPKKSLVELPQVPSPNPIDPGGGACFVADTLVVIDEKPTEQQTESAAQLHMPLDENVSDYDRAFWYLLAIGAIGVGGLQIYLNRERHKQQREQDAARQLRDGKSFAIYWKRKYGEPFELPDPVLLEQAEENDDARNKDALSAEATELPLSSESTVIAQMDRRCETMVDFHRIKTTDSAEDSRDAVENKAAPTANRSFAHWFNAGWILMWTVALACVIGASTLPSQAPDSPSSVNSVSIASKQLTYRPIDKIQIGDRVFAQNPTGKHDDSLGEVEPRTCARLHCVLRNVMGHMLMSACFGPSNGCKNAMPILAAQLKSPCRNVASMATPKSRESNLVRRSNRVGAQS